MLEEFTKYLLEQVANHSIYVRGGQGQNDITDEFITKREYGDEKQIKRVQALRDQYYKLGYKDVMRAFDCSGLGMYYLQNIKAIYSADMTANGMRSKCEQIDRNNVRSGDWVFITDSSGKANHVGYMITDTMLVEARGRDYGVIISVLDNRFNAYGRPLLFKEEIEQSNEALTDMHTLCDIIKKYSEV